MTRFKNTTDRAISVPTHAWQSPRWRSQQAGYVVIATVFLPGEVSDEITDIKEKDRFLKAGMEPMLILTSWERLLWNVW